jgi:hypothetical protein
MEATDVTYNSTFSDPPNDDLIPPNYFENLFDKGIIENLIDQRNLYSTQNMGKSINTSVIEMCQCIGIRILSGVVQMPKYRMYWADSNTLRAYVT